MKKQWTKIFAAAVIVNTAPANAIPVTFDFSGTIAQVVISDFATGVPIFDLSTAGQSFSAQFNVDTDLFGPAVSASTALGDRLTFSSELPGAVTSSLSINGEPIDFAPYATNRANVSFLDSGGIVTCGEGCSTRIAPDQFNLNVFSEDSTPVGLAATRTLSFSYVAPFAGFANPESAMSWFDFSPDFDLTQIASLPLLDSLTTSVSLSDVLFECSEAQCRPTGSRRTQFSVTSGSRTVAVPEPGTLGLLALGVTAVLLTRRRRALNA